MGNSVVGSLLPVTAVFIASILLIGYIWISSEYEQMRKNNERYAKEFVANQKSLLRTEVIRTKEYLVREKQSAESDLEEELISRVNDAYAIAQGIYETHLSTHSSAEIKQMIFSALRPIRFNNGRGYYFITSLSGIEYLYPPQPEFEGKHASEIFSPAGQDVVRRMIEISEQQGQGFVRYNWTRPDSKTGYYKKYSFVRLFQPYGLIIGTGDYLEDFEQAVKEQIFRRIASVTYGIKNEGYFFINSYDGDLYVTNGEYFGGEKNIWDVADAKGTKVVQENSRLAQANEEGAYSSYYWRKNSGEEAEKISYVLGFDDWRVFIGTGVYLDTVHREIAASEATHMAGMKKRISSAIVILVLASLLVMTVLYVITRKISKNILLFQNNLEKSVDNWTKLDSNELHFEEFQKLAVSINSMVDGLNMQADELKHSAFHDHLTALPNRLHGFAHLDQMISHTLDHQSVAALLFIDLDNFKEINDTLGHSAGDLLLRQVSTRLRSGVRDEDIVARLGGDEFTVITGLLNENKDAEIVAEKILAQFERPFVVDGSEFYVTASIGISLFPRDGDSAEILLRNADSAMYEVKRSGRNGYCFYQPEMTEEISKRFQMTDQLREAIEQEQFELYFQPQISLINGDIVGAEALIRWNHPLRGLVSPDQFIPYAESSNQIQKIGEWVLRQACSKLVEWHEAGYTLKMLAVNISSKQFNDELVVQLKRILEETGCKPSLLELEITESTLMENHDQVRDELDKLQALGIKLAIDDFGTGYSSLNYLKQLPIDKLKIDRSFIRDINQDENDCAITRAVIALGRNLNLTVIAEGVEHESQLEFLVNEQCAQAQGYLYSRPLPEKDFLAYLKDASFNRE
ncbi:MAG: EAL domain-containing protein [Neptuniibacter sp.]